MMNAVAFASGVDIMRIFLERPCISVNLKLDLTFVTRTSIQRPFFADYFVYLFFVSVRGGG